ncbi:MAG: LytTR family DNA-binding domain-containing protein [Bryobacteraceae bacterium]|nr:LytTR family DNA-binding domain-containing protein [Bryobacteraceae bacterium]
MSPLRVLIADDEGMARDRLQTLLAAMPEIRVAAECSNGPDTVSAILNLRPDLVFLDIRMPELDGFGVLDRIPPGRRPEFIFVTAWDTYAVRAFEARALDYLLKPFPRQRLIDAVNRVHARRSEPRLSFQAGRNTVLLRTTDVDWIESANNYACVHCGDQTYVVRETLHSLESRLPPDRFVRIHRSAIVNVSRVREIRPTLNGDSRVALDGGICLTVSRTFRERLDQLLSPSSQT